MVTRAAPRRRPLAGPPAGAPTARAVQLALFAEVVDVRPLDARAVAGPRTRVRGVWLVRYPGERAAGPHRVFADRHGWYCEAHGAGCRAVGAARDVAGERGAAP